MKDKEMVLSSNIKHTLQLGITLFLVGAAWATWTAKVDAIEKDEKEAAKKIDVLTVKVNTQAVTIGKIEVTTKNIEKQLDDNKRLLERISQQLPRPNN